MPFSANCFFKLDEGTVAAPGRPGGHGLRLRAFDSPEEAPYLRKN